MDDGFNLGVLDVSLKALIQAVAKEVASVVRADLARDGGTGVKQRLMTVEQAGVYLGRTKEAVQHLMDSGKISTVRPDRRVFIDIRDLDRWIEENKVTGIR